jgi:predicted membrane protein
MTGTILLIFLLLIYFIPTIIGDDKKYSTGIMLLNLFLGWTFVGWVAALVWAVSCPKK